MGALHFFGGELRRAREAKRYTVRELAGHTHMPWSASTISKIENGNQAPDIKFAEACDMVFPERDGWFARFWAAQAQWKGYSPLFTPWVAYESSAQAIRWWTAGFVPGLLQTEDYARAAIRAWLPLDEASIEQDIAKRLERQEILTRQAPTDLLALLDACVLYRQVGTAAVMSAQCAHLVKMAERPNVTIQVVPDGLAGLPGAIGIATAENTDVAAYSDSLIRPIVDTDTEQVRRAVRVFDHLRVQALTAVASATTITEAVERWDSM